ncbi:MAG: PAC2 family protein [Anaerolineae bacterium]|jgi:proteasome assembly chaperone (PAC2) family protein
MMNDLFDLWEKPTSAKYMIAGWYQWADAGEVSSGLPHYLVDEIGARHIGEMNPSGYYLFQFPGTHDLLRPMVTLNEGYRVRMEERRNAFYVAREGEDSFLIFIGDEPHMNVEQYTDAFLDAVESLGVERVAIVAGVNGAMPYDRDREISCVYSLPEMKEEIEGYAVRLSNYEGGATIGVYLADCAEDRGIELVSFYALVPAYDFSQQSSAVQRISAEEDYKAWYDLMRRIDYMFALDLDLSELERRSAELVAAWDTRIAQLKKKMPDVVGPYMDEVNEDFTERSFDPLGRAWEDALGDIFDDSEGTSTSER